MFEDGEDTEFEKPELEEEEPEPDTVTFTVSHKNLMTKMYRMYPDSFNLSNGVKLTLAHEHYNFSASTPKLIIDPSLTPGSFWDTPVWPGEPDNSTGVWPFQTRFPRGAHPYRAGYALRPPGRPIDIFIKDKVLRDFYWHLKLVQEVWIQQCIMKINLFLLQVITRLIQIIF